MKHTIPHKKKFEGVIYKLAHVHMYKDQAIYEAKYVREHGGFARVDKGHILIGSRNLRTFGWRVYTRE